MTESKGLKRSWLVVGHGSVGSWLSDKIADKASPLLILDPAPRVPIRRGQRLNASDGATKVVDFVVSCVPPAEASRVPALVARFLSPSTVFFEWNSASPDVKARIASETPCHVVDVALLDSLDGAGGHPLVAISGPEAADNAATLMELGFQVDVVGTRCGDAALLKFVRSAFMKSLEALLLEYYSLASLLDPSGVATHSIYRNLGARFEEFAQLMLKTNRLHAERRAQELADAADVLSRKNGSLPIAAAAIATLRRSARAWESRDAPAENASVMELMAFYRRSL